MPVGTLLDPQRRSRQFVAARLVELAGRRAGGFVLTSSRGRRKMGTANYSLVRQDKAYVKRHPELTLWRHEELTQGGGSDAHNGAGVGWRREGVARP